MTGGSAEHRGYVNPRLEGLNLIFLVLIAMSLQFKVWERIRESVQPTGAEGLLTAYQALCTMVLIVVLVLVPFRWRLPDKAVWAIFFLQLLIPLGIVSSIILPSFIKRKDNVQAFWISILHGINIPLWFALDLTGTSGRTSILRDFAGAPGSYEIPIGQAITIIAVLFLIFSVLPVVFGLFLRRKDEVFATLKRLIRPAGVTTNDPQLVVGERAEKFVRQLPAREERPQAPEPVFRHYDSLEMLSQAIQDARGTPRSFSAHVAISQGDSAPERLTSRVYQIVEELLDDLHESVYGATSQLLISGSPVNGIAIDRKWPVRVAGSGARVRGNPQLRKARGLVQGIGGTFSIYQEDPYAVVSIWLPWAALNRPSDVKDPHTARFKPGAER